MNVKQITDNFLCSGCGTCNTICAHNAISMKKTHTMGLLYADIDTDKCTDCGLCIKMCPSSHILEEKETVTKDKIVGNIKACYIGRSLNKEIFANAQSGGMVTTILAYLFDNQLIDAAVSCRMEYGFPTPSVHYSFLTSSDELKLNQKSCYTQVDIVSALKKTTSYKSIAIVGVPCHIQGVSNLMNLKKYNNIKYRIGLICDKTYSDSYMDAIMYGCERPKGNILINYRKKNFTHKGIYHSYQHAPTVISNRDGKMTIIPNSKRIFLKEYFAVPKCKICWDKLNTKADIVLGDPWGLTGKYDEKEGDNVLVVRSKKGEEILNDLLQKEYITVSQVAEDEVLEGQLINQRIISVKGTDWNLIRKNWNYWEYMSKKNVVKAVNRKYKKNHYIAILKRIVKQIVKK